jgi:hypothetical protein
MKFQIGTESSDTAVTIQYLAQWHIYAYLGLCCIWLKYIDGHCQYLRPCSTDVRVISSNVLEGKRLPTGTKLKKEGSLSG